jgi:hypothetical protein
MRVVRVQVVMGVRMVSYVLVVGRLYEVVGEVRHEAFLNVLHLMLLYARVAPNGARLCVRLIQLVRLDEVRTVLEQVWRVSRLRGSLLWLYLSVEDVLRRGAVELSVLLLVRLVGRIGRYFLIIGEQRRRA